VASGALGPSGAGNGGAGLGRGPASDPARPADGPAASVFPGPWRWAGICWWLVSAVAVVAVTAWWRTSLPFMARVVVAAGLETIPGLAVSRLLVRRAFPSTKKHWRLWLAGLRCFFCYGYLTCFVLVARWVERQPLSAPAWSTVRWLAIAFGAAALGLGAIAVADTVRHVPAHRRRWELLADAAIGWVVLSGPVAVVVRSTTGITPGQVSGVLAVLRPVAVGFGIAAGLCWFGALLRLLRSTAGLRAWSVDGIDLATVTVALAAPALVAIEPSLAAHHQQLWLLLPLLFLAVALPGMLCAAGMVMVRVPRTVRQTMAVTLLALLALSLVDAWGQILELVAPGVVPVTAVMAVASANFGLFLVVPLLERRRPVAGLSRLRPEAQVRQWDAIPLLVGAGVVALVAEALGSGSGTHAREAIIAVVLAVLVLLGAARHTLSLREARRLRWQIQRMTNELVRRTQRDPLTGLRNRRALLEQFDAVAAACQRTGRPLTVVMLDLDHFKRFNDRYGHLAGDQLLRTIAEAMRRTLRDGDVAARYGGEEFCLLLPGADPAEASALLGRLRRRLQSSGPGTVVAFDRRRPISAAGDEPGLVAAELAALRGALTGWPTDDAGWPGWGTEPAASPAPPAGPVVAALGVTFSAGVANWQVGEPFEHVAHRADQACYRAKAAGRDRVVLADGELRVRDGAST
jgi:diguanylate cyclase (GGDEF)-like protein